MTESQKSHAISLEREQNYAVGSRFQECCLIDYLRHGQNKTLKVERHNAGWSSALE
jgi:hypothetical protein